MSCDHDATDSWSSFIGKMCTRPLCVFSCSLSHCQAVSMTFWPRPVHRHHAYAWGRFDCRDCRRLPPGLLPPAALWRFAAAALDGPVRDAAVLVSLLPHRLHPATWCQHGKGPLDISSFFPHLLSSLIHIYILPNVVNVCISFRLSTTSVFLTTQSSQFLWLKRTISWLTGKWHCMYLNLCLGLPIDF